jgi:taurine--2-oxoglutarate transaminase
MQTTSRGIGSTMELPDELARLAEIDRKAVMHAWSAQAGYTSEIAVRAEGAYFWDQQGKRYLDMTSQAGFANIGLREPRVIEAIARQATQLPTIYGFASTAKLELAEQILALLPDSYARVFFGCNGADAVEAALKAARSVTGRQGIVAFWNEYHGASMGASSVTGTLGWPATTRSAVPGTVLVPGPYHYRSPLRGTTQEETDEATVAYLRKTIEQHGPEMFAAVIAEPFTTGGGAILPRPAFWRGVRALCDEFEMLLIADEIVTGFGRTGRWFARDHYKYEPDIICLGKGLSSGYLPLSAAVFKQEVAQHFEHQPFNHGMTYTGHPICCAAAAACIDVIAEDGLVDNAARMGDRMRRLVDELSRRHPCVGAAETLGLFSTIELVEDPDKRTAFGEIDPLFPEGGGSPAPVPAQVAGSMRSQGIIVRGTSAALKISPPLIVGVEQLETTFDALDDLLTSVDKRVVTN